VAASSARVCSWAVWIYMTPSTTIGSHSMVVAAARWRLLYGHPRHLQSFDVRRIDLVERRVAAGPGVAAILAPLARGVHGDLPRSRQKDGSAMVTAASATLRLRKWRRFGFSLLIVYDDCVIVG